MEQSVRRKAVAFVMEKYVRLSHGPSCLYKKEKIQNNITVMLLNLFGEILN